MGLGKIKKNTFSASLQYSYIFLLFLLCQKKQGALNILFEHISLPLHALKPLAYPCWTTEHISFMQLRLGMGRCSVVQLKGTGHTCPPRQLKQDDWNSEKYAYILNMCLFLFCQDIHFKNKTTCIMKKI